MNATIYKTNSDKRKLTKVLSDALAITCDVYNECSLMSPNLLIEFSPTLSGYNYIFINDFDRYYFIDDIEVDAGGRAIIRCTCDVLMSFNTEISNLTVTVTRNEFAETNNLGDPYVTFSAERDVSVFALENTPFNIRDPESGSRNFCLILGGGHIREPENNE